jgi:hypothetical protein
MLGKLSENKQRELFCPMLKDFINPRQELADAIDWTYFEEPFKSYCCSKKDADGKFFAIHSPMLFNTKFLLCRRLKRFFSGLTEYCSLTAFHPDHETTFAL